MRLRGQGSYKPANTQPPWWDETCEKLKHEKYTTLWIFKVTYDKKDLELYKECRGKFENMYLRQKNQYQSLQRQKLLDSRSNPRLFWQIIKRQNKKEKITVNISQDAFQNYFTSLLYDENYIDAKDNFYHHDNIS